ncbi:histidine phosphatase family protein [Agrilactobacillus yilanensis]|uniref:Histidine phosphatase family protein n=1 Tax=Agrilactobacillus yilanensis TaxID=2485997 RepID=A0ABW4J3I8_9LACO|nr:histidine phosphatase family protein [Agrilactobacillus yilanensis]
MKITMIRHGQTDYNQRRLVQGGRTDISLNETGRQQAQKLAAQFDPKIYDQIIVSPMTRAMETAEILTGYQDCKTDERLREIDFGNWEGESVMALQKTCPGCFDRQTKLILPDYAPVANGETFEAARARTFALVTDTFAAWPEGNILLICHGTIIRCLMAEVMHIAQVQQLGQVANVSLTQLTINNLITGDVRLDFYNRTV